MTWNNNILELAILFYFGIVGIIVNGPNFFEHLAVWWCLRHLKYMVCMFCLKS